MNGFLTAGRKKNGEVEDELDRSLEGMDHSDDQFDKGTTIACVMIFRFGDTRDLWILILSGARV